MLVTHIVDIFGDKRLLCGHWKSLCMSLNESELMTLKGYLSYFDTLCMMGVTPNLPLLGVIAKYASNSILLRVLHGVVP
jgi:hypothetical protein